MNTPANPGADVGKLKSLGFSDWFIDLLLKFGTISASNNNGATVATWRCLKIRTTDINGTIYNLPAKSLITHIIVRSVSGNSVGIQLYKPLTGTLIDLIPNTAYSVNGVETFAPAAFIEVATQVQLFGTGFLDSNVDIFYTTTTV